MTAPAIHSADSLRRMTFEQACAAYKAVIQDGRPELLRWMARNDRFFLLTCVMGRRDALHPWIYERCREVETEPEGVLDLWSRFHYKSTIITLAGAVQEILRDPEVTIGIFSHVIGLSKKFVKQIQRALEDHHVVAQHAAGGMVAYKVPSYDAVETHLQKQETHDVDQGFQIGRAHV